MLVDQVTEEVAAIVDRYPGDRGATIAVLQDIQARYRYLPREAMEEAARQLDVPLSQLYAIATFYRAFSLIPRGRHTIKVCLGTACHVRGAVRTLEKIERELGVGAGHTTADLNFNLETVSCLGACALGPLVTVDDKYYGKTSPTKVSRILGEYTSAEGGQ